MTQSVLNFQLEGTQERFTPYAGLAIFGEYLEAIGLRRLFSRYVPAGGSNRSYTPYEVVLPLLLMHHAGGRHLEDLRKIERDQALRSVLKLERMPQSGSVGKWLKQRGLQGIYALGAIERQLVKRYLKRKERTLTLDIDATFMSTHKRSAEATYKGFPGYGAMLGHIDGGFLLHSELRSGNIPPADSNLAFVERCIEQLPEGVRLTRLRADAASYQHALFDACEARGIT